MTYDNARLPEALIRGGIALGDRALVESGLTTLAFYESVTIEDERLRAHRQRRLVSARRHRARFGQQPLEAAAMVDAALAALAATGDRRRLRGSPRSHSAWYFGRTRSAP